jgi:hypothetical protein
MNIIINDKLLPTLQRLAEVNSITSEEFAASVLDAYLLSQYKQDLTDKINNTTIDELSDYETAIVSTNEAITAKKIAAMPIIEAPVEEIIPE